MTKRKINDDYSDIASPNSEGERRYRFPAANRRSRNIICSDRQRLVIARGGPARRDTAIKTNATISELQLTVGCCTERLRRFSRPRTQYSAASLSAALLSTVATLVLGCVLRPSKPYPTPVPPETTLVLALPAALEQRAFAGYFSLVAHPSLPPPAPSAAAPPPSDPRAVSSVVFRSRRRRRLRIERANGRARRADGKLEEEKG